MRRLLDFLYDSAAALAALFMVGLLGMVMLSIASRQFHFHVPGTDAYAGYLMAAAGFLALAHTLKRGEHIRVTLLLNFLKGGAKKAFEIWALAIASLLALFDPNGWDQDQLLGSFLFITTATVLASISLAKQTRGKGMAIAALVMAVIALLGTCGTRL